LVIRFTCVDEVGKVGNIDAVNGLAYGGISHSMACTERELDDVKKNTNLKEWRALHQRYSDDITVISS
jgi:aldehyde oxidoreductase